MHDAGLPTRSLPPALQPVLEAIPRAMIADRRRLHARLMQLASGPRDEAGLAALQEQVRRSAARAEARGRLVPVPGFAMDLPVLARREEIAKVIAGHQVCVICGETGSGKTTQLPQICLSIGRGVHGMIGHTQPRRIAARSVAQRIADELGTTLGPQGVVGYKVRFGDETSDRTLVKLMTDGVLLAEVQNDRDLLAYDTIIIDEAHERSLNIDFLLGYLRQLLPRRPDLKVIITSATIDPQRLSGHFGGPVVCPVVEVSGRTYAVDIRYHKMNEFEKDDFEANEEVAVLDAIDALTRPGMWR
ncbi:MAG: DEAD/DEAH box helicase, partial [bacterium]